jgi:isoleucyl-tRNA synthetase
MSKSYGNFVDPQEVIPQFGGEAIRMILANSPVSYGGDTALKDEYFLDMTKRFMLPVWNSFSFLTTYANLDNRTPSSELVAAIKADDWSKVTNDSTNILDRWIITLCKKLLDDVSK